MSKRLLPFLALSLLLPFNALAIWPFGDSDEESEAELAERVSDLMRDPRRVIAEAQMAADDGNTETAIAKFREAQGMLEAIERSNDTSDAAFATLRLAKFHCISMLDDLVLRRAKVTDTRQAVTDTADLEAILEKEREAQRKAEEAAQASEKPSRPPTLREQLPKLEAAAAEAKARWVEAAKAVETAKQADEAAQKAFLEAARTHTRVDGLYMVARAKAGADDDEALTEAAEARNQARTDLAAAKARTAETAAAIEPAEKALADAQAALTEALSECDAVRNAIAREEAEAKAREEAEKTAAEAERKRLEAEALIRKQKAAEAAAAARAKAEQVSAEKAKAREQRLAWCEEMWNSKDIDALEQELAAILGEKPDEARALVLLAQLRLLQGRAADALDLVALIPADGETGLRSRMVAAGAYVSLKQPFDAMRILEQAMKDAPSAPAPYLNMATVLMTLPAGSSKPEIAEQYYRRAVSLGAKRSLTLERRLGIAEPRH